MNARSILTGAVLVLSTAAITSQVVSQDSKTGAKQPPMSAEEQAMMQKWMEFATPNEHHKVLEAKVGKWNDTVKMWMDPAAPPEESKGTSEFEMALGGRYLMDHTSGESSMGPFEGMGVTGYDNIKKKYVGGWVDNMGTGVMFAEGTYDAKTKTFTFSSEAPDPMTGKYVKQRVVEKWLSADKFVMEAYGPGKDGKEYKCMEITYERAK